MLESSEKSSAGKEVEDGSVMGLRGCEAAVHIM